MKLPIKSLKQHKTKSSQREELWLYCKRKNPWYIVDWKQHWSTTGIISKKGEQKQNKNFWPQEGPKGAKGIIYIAKWTLFYNIKVTEHAVSFSVSISISWFTLAPSVRSLRCMEGRGNSGGALPYTHFQLVNILLKYPSFWVYYYHKGWKVQFSGQCCIWHHKWWDSWTKKEMRLALSERKLSPL